MKRVKLVIHQPLINKVIGKEVVLILGDSANLLDAISEVDKIIAGKGGFPVPHYRSLLHMVYNPIENRFYNQVAIAAHRESSQMLNLRENLKSELPEGATVILIPAGGCIGEWEEAIDYEEFLKAK